jgi:Homeodomain-like domain
MLQVDHEKWGQTLDDLRQLAVSSEHPRTRERFLALYEVARGQSATAWAARSERHDDTVQAWVHAYNQSGPEALTYRRTGGVRPFARRSHKGSETSCGPRLSSPLRPAP